MNRKTRKDLFSDATLLLARHGVETEYLSTVLSDFTHRTGVSVEIVYFHPAPSFFSTDFTPPSLESFAGKVDLVFDTAPLLARYEAQGDLLPLPEAVRACLEAERADVPFLPSGNRALHRLPLFLNLHGLLRRKDAGAPAIERWEDLEIRLRDAGRGNETVVFGWTGDPALAFHALGGSPGPRALRNPEGMRAYSLLLAHRRHPGFMPGQNALFLSYEEAIHGLDGGSLALVLGAPASLRAYLKGEAADRIAFSPLPPPPGRGGHPLPSCHQVALLRSAPRLEAARRLLEFLADRHALLPALTLGAYPARFSLLEGPSPIRGRWEGPAVARAVRAAEDPDHLPLPQDHRRFANELQFLLDHRVGPEEARSLLETLPATFPPDPRARRHHRLLTRALRDLERGTEPAAFPFKNRYAAFREHQELLEDMEEVFSLYNVALTQKELALKNALADLEGLHRRAEFQNKALLSLHRAGADLRFSKPLSVLLKGILRGLREGLGVVRAAVLTWSPEERRFEGTAAIGLTARKVREIHLAPPAVPDGEEGLIRMLREREPRLQEALAAALGEGFDGNRLLAEPLEVRGELVGLLALEEPAAGDLPSEVLGIFARQAALTVDNARLFARVEQMALRDTLTGLYNRRSLQQFLEYEVNRSRRYRLPLSLIFLDLDRFKEVNDRHGHAVGDRLLRQTARRLSNLFRSTDFLARYAGDEFVAVLPCTPHAGAMVLASRVREVLEDCSFPVKGGTVRISASLGVDTFEGEERVGAASLLARADKAMYEAKRAGRNRVMSLRASSAAAVRS